MSGKSDRAIKFEDTKGVFKAVGPGSDEFTVRGHAGERAVVITTTIDRGIVGAQTAYAMEAEGVEELVKALQRWLNALPRLN